MIAPGIMGLVALGAFDPCSELTAFHQILRLWSEKDFHGCPIEVVLKESPGAEDFFLMMEGKSGDRAGFRLKRRLDCPKGPPMVAPGELSIRHGFDFGSMRLRTELKIATAPNSKPTRLSINTWNEATGEIFHRIECGAGL
jgi:hypothetical protein